MLDLGANLDVVILIAIGLIVFTVYKTVKYIISFLKLRRFERLLEITRSKDFDSLTDKQKSIFVDFVDLNKDSMKYEDQMYKLKYDSQTYSLQRLVYLFIALIFSLALLFNMVLLGLDMISHFSQLNSSAASKLSIDELSTILLNRIPLILIFQFAVLVFYRLSKKARINYNYAKNNNR